MMEQPFVELLNDFMHEWPIILANPFNSEFPASEWAENVFVKGIGML